ncbi:hypothetical protein HMPREF2533_02668 [Bacteroides fragilis]|uniref:Transmembrane protein n=1 Tax=Bacteroides fragilis (strain ATCC 25285 / DSM 2151 / CCUG 4856 / JCM 11019 / LMG 10263 / NCTC 9343 / Onslow / VPI 2553 / EN-2) TaxID=272559 RepID=Q5LF70_BACFN|nr:hypothetical protein HMPREF2530_02668 [Bacteroides fragilis]KXU44715.1 hypothetical protein HMPREF2533_02668 [Bacteroides fragilis]CAH07228.1 hypothetical protein BF9343_1447 [Bacteroides fragilis NCTC 9343]
MRLIVSFITCYLLYYYITKVMIFLRSCKFKHALYQHISLLSLLLKVVSVPPETGCFFFHGEDFFGGPVALPCSLPTLLRCHVFSGEEVHRQPCPCLMFRASRKRPGLRAGGPLVNS